MAGQLINYSYFITQLNKKIVEFDQYFSRIIIVVSIITKLDTNNPVSVAAIDHLLRC